MIRMTDMIRSRRDRRRMQQRIADETTTGVETLEQRQLLTLAMNFDFTAFASDRSPDQRLFGSTDPADAPLQIIHYGQGTVTSLVGINGGGLLDNPGDLTFEFGSQDAASTVTQLSLAEFDDGVADGVANQIYRGSSALDVRFLYQGTQFSTGRLTDLELRTTSDRQTTGSVVLEISDVNIPPTDLQYELLELLQLSFHRDLLTESRATPLAFNNLVSTGAWTGAADGEVFGSPGAIESVDDATDTMRFATDWDFASPYAGVFEEPGDRDWIRTTVTPNVELTFEAPENTAFVDYQVVTEDRTVIHNFIGPESTIFPPRSFVSPVSVVYFEFISGQSSGRGEFEISLTGTEAAPWQLSRDSGDQISWTIPTDATGAELPVDSWRVTITSNGDLARVEELNSSTLEFNYADLGGLSRNQIVVERIVSGEVAQTSDSVSYSGRTPRANITTSGGSFFEWDPIPGAVRYELFLNDPTNVVSVTDTNYTLPPDYPLGWHRAWVRGVGDRLTRGLWSQPRNYHARSAMQPPVVVHETIGRPTINWTPLGGAARYELSVQNVSTGEFNVVQETALTGTTYSVMQDLAVGTYRAWMRGLTEEGVPGQWAASERFTVGPAPAGVAAGSSVTRPVFTWSVPTGVESVDLFILNSGNVTTMSDLTGTSWTATSDFAAGNITWWVRGADASGNRTGWSLPQTVRIGSSQIDGSEASLEVEGAPLLTWLAVVGAESYELLFRSYTDGDVRTVTGLTDTSHQPEVFGPGRYSVWVNTIFPGGGNAWSNRFQFDVAPRDFRILVGPSGNVATDTPTVVWLPDASPSATRLWVRNETANTNTQVFVLSGDSYTFTQPLTAGTYRIWAIDHNNTSAGWSQPIVIIVSQADEEDSLNEPESLLAGLELSPFVTEVKDAPALQTDPRQPVERDVPPQAPHGTPKRNNDKSPATDTHAAVFGEVGFLLGEPVDADEQRIEKAM